MKILHDPTVSSAQRRGFANGMLKGSIDLLRSVPGGEELKKILECDADKVVRLITHAEMAPLEKLIADPKSPHPIKEVFEDKAQSLSLEENLESHRSFSAGYALMVGKRKGKDSADIYQYMFLNWRRIEELKKRGEGVPGLRVLLSEHFKSDFLGSDRRLGKLCAGVGLTLARAGRPKKNTPGA